MEPLRTGAVGLEPQEELGTDCEELLNLTYLNQQVAIKPLRDKPSTQVQNQVILRTESPSCFFTKLDVQVPYGLFADWTDAFTGLYSDDKASSSLNLMSKAPIKHRCYACLDPVHGSWERARLLDFNSKDQTARVFFYDTFECQTVPVSNLREILPAFSRQPVTTFRAELVDIRPTSGRHTWSPEACSFFQDYVKGKTFRTLAVNKISQFQVEGYSHQFPHLSVFMMEHSPATSLHLQAVLVKHGFAEMCGPLSSHPKMLDLPGDIFPKSFSTQRPSKFVETERDKEKNRIISAALEQLRMNPIKGCNTKKGKKAAARQLKETKASIQSQLKSGLWGPTSALLASTLKPSVIPKELQLSLGSVKVSHVNNPASMFLQFTSRLPLLEEMEDALGRHVEPMPSVPRTETNSGIPIACLFSKRPKSHEDPIWARAVVIAYIPSDNLIKVLMVDYGADMCVRYHNSRYLPNTFKSVPSFAHRVFLNFPHMVPTSGSSWDVEFLKNFRTHVSLLDTQNSTLYAVTDNQSSFTLNSYYQQMIFKDGKWVPKVTEDKKAERTHPLDSQSDLPILRHFFSTYGVQLFYEINSKTGKNNTLEFGLLDGSSGQEDKTVLVPVDGDWE